MLKQIKSDLFDLIKTLFGHIPYCYETESYQSNDQYLEDIAALSLFFSRLIELKKEIFGNAIRSQVKVHEYGLFDISSDTPSDRENKRKVKEKQLCSEILHMKAFVKEFYSQFKKVIRATLNLKQVSLPLEEMYRKNRIPELGRYIYYYFIGGQIIANSSVACFEESDFSQLFDYNVKILAELEKMISPDSQLVRSGMLRSAKSLFDSTFLYSRIEIPARVLSLTLCNKTENPDVMEYATVYEPTVSLDDIVMKKEIKERLVALVKGYNEFGKIKKRMGFDNGLIKKNGYLIMLEGAAGTGKTLLAEGLAKYMGKKLMNIDTSNFVYQSMSDEKILSSAFDGILLEAKMNDALVFFDECEDLFGPWHRSIFLPVLEKFNGIILCATNMAHHIVDDALNRRILYRVHFEIPEVAERELIWQKHIPVKAPLEKNVDLRYLAKKYEFSGGLIKNAIIKAVNYTIACGDRKIKQSTLESACDEINDVESNHSMSERSDILTKMSDLIFDSHTGLSVKRFLAACRNKNKLFVDWGLSDKYHYGNNIVALFYGSSGVGKTACAEAIAGELGYRFVNISISDVQSKWVGDTQKNIKQLFRQHSNKQVVLFFDEAEALFSRRTDIRNALDKEMNRDVNVLLQELEKFEGIVILTTNKPDTFDEAFTRRIQFKIQFSLPDSETRLKLWKHLIPKKMQLSENVDFLHLAKNYELSGAGIKNSIFRAATIAVADDVSLIEMKHLILAVEEELNDVQKNRKTIGF